MSNSGLSNFSNFFETTKNLPPHRLLQEAVSLIDKKDRALDLGAGALRDTRFLLSDGFKEVVAVDASGETSAMAEAIGDERLTAVESRFEDYQFPQNWFDLVSSQFALPFCYPEQFPRVFDSLVSSLVQKGVFTGHLFGDRDEWANKQSLAKTFHTKAEAEEVFTGLDIRKFNEVEVDGQIADGTPKHWHYFEVIAVKR